MNSKKKFVKQSFVFDKETLPIGMPYAITNKEANGNEFFALLRNVSPDLLVFKVVDVTGDEYDYTVSVNSYIDEKVVIRGPLYMTHYIDDPEGEWKLREVPECNKIEVTSEMLFGRNAGIMPNKAVISAVDDHNMFKATLKPEPEVHLMNENIIYKTDLKKILVGAALCDLCNQISDRVKDKTLLILQSPLSFMDAYYPCSIMITKDWYDNNETIVWVCFDNSMLFAPDRIVTHERPSVIFSKAYYEADLDDGKEIECNDDEISEVLYGILSKVYNEPEKVIHNKTEEQLRIVYEE